MWVSGKPTACLACGAPGQLRVIEEWWDRHDQVFVGTVECGLCHKQSAYTRRVETVKQQRSRRRRLVQLALPFEMR